MDKVYLAPSGLAPEHLNASIRPGLFFPASGEAPFLVAQHENGKIAVSLGEMRGREAFISWMLLDPNTTGWSGITSGDVEIEVDISSMSAKGAEVGDVVLNKDGAFLHASGEDRWDRNQIKLATSAGNVASKAREIVFKSWRLIQRDASSNAIVLFERDAAEANSD